MATRVAGGFRGEKAKHAMVQHVNNGVDQSLRRIARKSDNQTG